MGHPGCKIHAATTTPGEMFPATVRFPWMIAEPWVGHSSTLPARSTAVEERARARHPGQSRPRAGRDVPGLPLWNLSPCLRKAVKCRRSPGRTGNEAIFAPQCGMSSNSVAFGNGECENTLNPIKAR